MHILMHFFILFFEKLINRVGQNERSKLAIRGNGVSIVFVANRNTKKKKKKGTRNPSREVVELQKEKEKEEENVVT